MNNRNLTDQQRVTVAKLEYQLLEPNQVIILAGQPFGKVLQHIYTADGLQMFVIENRPQKEYTLLFKGSSGIMKGNPETWTNEWLDTNLPIGWSMLFQRGEIPQQLRTATRVLNRVLCQHPNAHFYLYGHSLGSINVQYALSHCHHIGQIRRADIYEGPNIYWLLNASERKQVRKFKHKVYNYVDVYDPIVVGYVDRRRLVGRLKYVDSHLLPPINQHMWGGYMFTSRGKLKTRSIDKLFLKRGAMDQYWMKNGHELYQERLNLRQLQQLKKIHHLSQLAFAKDWRNKSSRRRHLLDDLIDFDKLPNI